MNTKTLPVTQEHLELYNKPTIASQTPIEFPNGRTLNEVQGVCGGCKKPIEDERLRGEIIRYSDSMVMMNMIGACEDCQTLTTFRYRVYDDLRFVFQRNGQWVTTYPRFTGTTIWAHIKFYAKKFLFGKQG